MIGHREVALRGLRVAGAVVDVLEVRLVVQGLVERRFGVGKAFCLEVLLLEVKGVRVRRVEKRVGRNLGFELEIFVLDQVELLLGSQGLAGCFAGFLEGRARDF